MSLKNMPVFRFNSDVFHSVTSKPPTAIFPRAKLILREDFVGEASDSPMAANNLVFPLDSSPRMTTTSPALHDMLTPRHAQALRKG
jgi:hypothetical protein